MDKWCDPWPALLLLVAILFALSGFGMAIAGVEEEWPFMVCGAGFGLYISLGLSLMDPDE